MPSKSLPTSAVEPASPVTWLPELLERLELLEEDVVELLLPAFAVADESLPPPPPPPQPTRARAITHAETPTLTANIFVSFKKHKEGDFCKQVLTFRKLS
jgi:hypothetical protein